MGSTPSVIGQDVAVSICSMLGLHFTLEALDCPPFEHSFGPDGSHRSTSIGIWRLPLTSLEEHLITIPFYVLDDPTQRPTLGNSLLSHCVIDSVHNRLLVYPSSGICSRTVTLPLYHHFEGQDKRTSLSVFVTSRAVFQSFAVTSRDWSNKNACKLFAGRLHMFTHWSARDMIQYMRRASISSPELAKAFRVIEERCTSCKLSRPRARPSSKISMTSLDKSFNEEVQLDLFFIFGLIILHVIDVSTRWSETEIIASRELDTVRRSFEYIWVFRHGAPRAVSGDNEFFKGEFDQMLSTHSIESRPRPARRPNKNGIVERRNGVIKKLMSTLVRDDDTLTHITGRRRSSKEILQQATFLGHQLYGGAILSSFERTRGYQPSLLGIGPLYVSKSIFEAFNAAQTRRAIRLLMRHRQPSAAILPIGRAVYFYKDSMWMLGYVVAVSQHVVTVAHRADGSGTHLKIAHEDIQLVPDSPLLSDLDTANFALGQPIDPENPPNTADQAASEDFIAMRACTQTSRTTACQRDVGSTTVHCGVPSPGEAEQMRLAEYSALRDARNTAGPGPHTERTIRNLLPAWIVDKAIQAEIGVYSKAVQSIERRNLPPRPNIVHSHALFTIKLESQERLRLKCRLVPHGNRDGERHTVRKDSNSASLFAIRLLLSLSALLKLRLFSVDIKGAYMQARPLSRRIFMCPPKSWGFAHTVWELIRPAYGIVEAGRLWQQTINEFLLSLDFEVFLEIPEFFVVRRNGQIVLMIAKLVDDFLIAGDPGIVEEFYARLRQKFETGDLISGMDLRFAGMRVRQRDDYSITAEMDLADLSKFELDATRRKDHDAPCTAEEISAYRQLCGRLVYPGQALAPQASVTASLLQQRLPSLTVADLKVANQALSQLQRTAARIHYRSPSQISSMKMIAFSDASHTSTYGQTGLILGLYAQCDSGDICHFFGLFFFQTASRHLFVHWCRNSRRG